MAKEQYQIHPIIQKKIANRPFELSVLRAIFYIENSNRSLFKLPDHPSTWGWAARWDIAQAMGFKVGTKDDKQLSKSLSRKIRTAFLWLELIGYLKHHDVNAYGNNQGATRFLIAFWILKVVALVRAGVSLGQYQSKAVSRTGSVVPPGWKPPSWMIKHSPLAAAHANI